MLQSDRPNFSYKATVLRVVDGDTVDAEIDLGFRMKTTQRLRLKGIDTPELRGGTDEAQAKGQLAKSVVE